MIISSSEILFYEDFITQPYATGMPASHIAKTALQMKRICSWNKSQALCLRDLHTNQSVFTDKGTEGLNSLGARSEPKKVSFLCVICVLCGKILSLLAFGCGFAALGPLPLSISTSWSKPLVPAALFFVSFRSQG
jgi:hypothetical protein